MIIRIVNRSLVLYDDLLRFFFCGNCYHFKYLIFIFLASSDNMARLWSVDTGEVKKEYSGHQKAVVCLAFRDEIVQ